jgi:hypothetical protein
MKNKGNKHRINESVIYLEHPVGYGGETYNVRIDI